MRPDPFEFQSDTEVRNLYALGLNLRFGSRAVAGRLRQKAAQRPGADCPVIEDKGDKAPGVGEHPVPGSRETAADPASVAEVPPAGESGPLAVPPAHLPAQSATMPRPSGPVAWETRTMVSESNGIPREPAPVAAPSRPVVAASDPMPWESAPIVRESALIVRESALIVRPESLSGRSEKLLEAAKPLQNHALRCFAQI
jgi:hypothetical protein